MKDCLKLKEIKNSEDIFVNTKTVFTVFFYCLKFKKRHPVLGKHLVEITEEVLNIKNRSATEIFGHPDDLKLRSSMTLFANIEDSNPVFRAVLERFFSGAQDHATIQQLKIEKIG